MNRSVNKSKIFMIIGICTLCISIIGSTVAYYREVLVDDLTVNTVTQGLDYFINYTKGNSITGAELNLGEDYTDGVNTSIVFYKKDNTYDLYGHIYLDVTTIGTNLSGSTALKYALVNNGTVIGEGSLKGYSDGDSILIKDNIVLQTTSQTYTIYIWLDTNENPDVSIEGENLSLTVRCEATMEMVTTQ